MIYKKVIVTLQNFTCEFETQGKRRGREGLTLLLPKESDQPEFERLSQDKNRFHMNEREKK